MKRIFSLTILLLLAVTAGAQDRLYADEFPLGDVTLLDGPLKRAQELNVRTLLQYDCDRLLAPYRKEAGLTPKAKAYPNWDGLDGHVGGHYLTAMSMNAATGDEECRRRMEYIISELQECAEANARNHPEWGKGYVGGMPNSEGIWTTFKKGDFGTYFGSWAPFYNLGFHPSFSRHAKVKRALLWSFGLTKTFIRYMPDCATHGSIVVTSRRSAFSSASATGQSA